MSAKPKTGRVEPVAALLCDDVRREEGGILSLMGVAAPIIVFLEFPARKRITPVLIFTGIETGMAKVTVSLRWQDEVKWQVETDLEIDERGTGSVIPLDPLVAGFEQPGVLWLEVETGGKQYQLQNWRIEAQAPDYATPV